MGRKEDWMFWILLRLSLLQILRHKLNIPLTLTFKLLSNYKRQFQWTPVEPAIHGWHALTLDFNARKTAFPRHSHIHLQSRMRQWIQEIVLQK
jgi:hypothetical protein